MPTNRTALLLALLTLLMGGLALYSFVQLRRVRTELALTRQQVLARDRMLFRQQHALQRQSTDTTAAPVNSDTVKVMPPAAAVFADELGTLTGNQLSDLMKAGLPEDPEAFLKQDLLRHQADLLPAGSMGGTPHITDIRILTPHHALAAWEDGHVAGSALLRFDVRDPGKVSWRNLDTVQD